MPSYPNVVPGDVVGFARAWNYNGIKMLLDTTSLKFAVDFANVVLRSYVDDLAKNTKTTATPVAPSVPMPLQAGIVITG